MKLVNILPQLTTEITFVYVGVNQCMHCGTSLSWILSSEMSHHFITFHLKVDYAEKQSIAYTQSWLCKFETKWLGLSHTKLFQP